MSLCGNTVFLPDCEESSCFVLQNLAMSLSVYINDNFRVGFNAIRAFIRKHYVTCNYMWWLYVGVFNMFKYLKEVNTVLYSVFIISCLCAFFEL